MLGLADLWNYRQCCHGVILTDWRLLMRAEEAANPMKSRAKRLLLTASAYILGDGKGRD